MRGVYTASVPGQSPRMNYQIIHTDFTAADAARMTGLTQEEQRDWRKRQLLPPITGGKARFQILMLAGMLVAKKLVDTGMTPQSVRLISQRCGRMIYTRLLNRRRGVYDPQSLAAGPLVAGDGQSDVMAKWAIVDEPRVWGYAATPEELIDQLGDASIVLDLDRLAGQLVDRAQRPLAVIGPIA